MTLGAQRAIIIKESRRVGGYLSSGRRLKRICSRTLMDGLTSIKEIDLIQKAVVRGYQETEGRRKCRECL